MAPNVIPTRWHAPREPGLLPIPRLLLRAFGARIIRDDPRVGLLRDALYEGDPPADEVVEWMQREGAAEHNRALFERALTSGIESISTPKPSEPLAAFFGRIDRTPSWLDRNQLILGTGTILRVGRAGMYALAGSSLMSGYLSSGAVKPLAATGALARMARRRLAETAKFVRDVATSGALHRFSDGFVTTVRVRIMHATVRRGLLRSPDWRTEAWGTPINQSDMVGTLLEFSAVFILGLAGLGHLLSQKEREAVMHLWRYVGLLMGTREDLLFSSFKESLEIAQILNATEEGPDEDSRNLARALVATWSEGLPNTPRWALALEGRFLSGYSRFILGRRAADALGIPDDAWKLAPLCLAPARLAEEALIRIIPAIRAQAIRSGRARIEADLEAGLQGSPPTFGSRRTSCAPP